MYHRLPNQRLARMAFAAYSPEEITEALYSEIAGRTEGETTLPVRGAANELEAGHGIDGVEPALPGETCFFVTTTTGQRFRVTIGKA